MELPPECVNLANWSSNCYQSPDTVIQCALNCPIAINPDLSNAFPWQCGTRLDPLYTCGNLDFSTDVGLDLNTSQDGACSLGCGAALATCTGSPAGNWCWICSCCDICTDAFNACMETCALGRPDFGITIHIDIVNSLSGFRVSNLHLNWSARALSADLNVGPNNLRILARIDAGGIYGLFQRVDRDECRAIDHSKFHDDPQHQLGL